jgi:hypothetical protein
MSGFGANALAVFSAQCIIDGLVQKEIKVVAVKDNGCASKESVVVLRKVIVQ